MELSLQGGNQGREVGNKRIDDLTAMFEKRQVHGEHRGVLRHLLFICRAHYHGFFSGRKRAHWCTALISFHIERNKNVYQKVATGEVEVGGVGVGETRCGQQFVLNDVRMWDKLGATSSLRHTLLISSHSFTSPQCFISAPLLAERGPRPQKCYKSRWAAFSRCSLPLWTTCVLVYIRVQRARAERYGAGSDFSCTISTAVLAVAEMLLSNSCNIKS